jgi:transposase
MESIIALCGKLIRVIFAILTKGKDYDAKKMMDDMNRSMKAA